MRRSMLALLLALGLVLAACASDPEAGGTTAASGEETTAPGEETTAPEGEEPEDGEEPEGGDAEAGAEVFAGTCATCHGPEGKGITGLGKDFTTSQFVADSTDAELVAFLEVGRPADDPLNTTGVAMPPKGGNPALTAEDLADVIAFVRTLQEG